MIWVGAPRSKADYERMLKNFEVVEGLKNSDAILLLTDSTIEMIHNKEEVLQELARTFKGKIRRKEK